MSDDKPAGTPESVNDPAPSSDPGATQPIAPEELPAPATDENTVTTRDETAPVVAEPAPVAEQPVPVVAEEPARPGVVYVHAPTPPKVQHNRLFGALLALLGVIVFALVYLGVVALFIAVTGDDFQLRITEFLNTALYWVPILYFAAAFIVLALVLNRAGWAAYIVGSLVVALLVYGLSLGTLFLIQNNVVRLTPAEAQEAFLVLVGNLGLIIAAIVAREVSIWFGLAISVRGRRVRERNAEAKAAYDVEQAEKKAEYERAAATV